MIRRVQPDCASDMTPAIPFLCETVGGMLAAVARRFADREAIVATDWRISYRTFHREAQRVARALLALGVRKDDKVALWLPSRPAWFFVQYAATSWWPRARSRLFS